MFARSQSCAARSRPGWRALTAVVSAGVLSAATVAPAAVGLTPGGRAGAGWGENESVASVPLDQFDDYAEPQVAVASDGSAVAAWLQRSASGVYRVRVTHRASSGTWAEPVTASPRLRQYAAVHLAATPHQGAAVTWERWVDGRWRVEQAACGIGGCDSPEVVGRGRSPRVAADRQGSVTVAWESETGMSVRSRSTQGHWGRIRTVLAKRISTHDLAVNGGGDTVLAWYEWRTQRLRGITRPHGQGWRPASTLMRARTVPKLRTTLDSVGRAMVVWSTASQWNDAQGEYRNGIAFASTDGLGNWRRAQHYNHSVGEDGMLLDVAMNPRGDGLAVWLQGGQSGADPYTLDVALFGSRGRWGLPTKLADNWFAASAWMGADRTARVLVDRGAWIRMTQHRRGHGWSDETRLFAGQLADVDGNRTRMVALWYGDEQAGDELPLWARVLDLAL